MHGGAVSCSGRQKHSPSSHCRAQRLSTSLARVRVAKEAKRLGQGLGMLLSEIEAPWLFPMRTDNLSVALSKDSAFHSPPALNLVSPSKMARHTKLEIAKEPWSAVHLCTRLRRRHHCRMKQRTCGVRAEVEVEAEVCAAERAHFEQQETRWAQVADVIERERARWEHEREELSTQVTSRSSC